MKNIMRAQGVLAALTLALAISGARAQSDSQDPSQITAQNANQLQQMGQSETFRQMGLSDTMMGASQQLRSGLSGYQAPAGTVSPAPAVQPLGSTPALLSGSGDTSATGLHVGGDNNYSDGSGGTSGAGNPGQNNQQAPLTADMMGASSSGSGSSPSILQQIEGFFGGLGNEALSLVESGLGWIYNNVPLVKPLVNGFDNYVVKPVSSVVSAVVNNPTVKTIVSGAESGVKTVVSGAESLGSDAWHAITSIHL